jgi:hypothetical protein
MKWKRRSKTVKTPLDGTHDKEWAASRRRLV